MRKKLDVKLHKIREENLEMIMNWRMMPEITKYMNTDPKLTLDGQKRWFEKLKQSRTDFYWMVEVEGVSAGIASLVDLDGIAKRIHTGVYIAVKAKRSLRLTTDLQWNLYAYAFDRLGMEKVCEEIFAENVAVLRMLDMCGSKSEGILRNHVYKNGVYHDIAVRGILREEWEEMREKLDYTKFVFE